MGKDFYLGWSKTKLKTSVTSSSLLLGTKALCCDSSPWEVLQYAGILQNVVHRCKGF